MKLFICIDDQNGMMFNNRRQSRDKVLVSKIFEIVGGEPLFVLPYSEKLFKENGNVIVCENPFLDADENGFCFYEGKIDDISTVNELFVFCWNCEYPSDVKFDFLPENEGFSLAESIDFQGSSHDNITLKIFRR